jgi:signal peptidase
MKKILNKTKNLGKVFYWIVIVLLLIILSGTAFSIHEAPGGVRMFVVISGSMEPKIKAGSVVVIKSQKTYKEGDIITFLTDLRADIKNVNSVVTHRIFSVHDDEGRATYKTKGDANDTPDLEMITQSQVLGKALFSIPLIGIAVAFTRTQLGFTLLVIVPGVLIIYHEILKIKQEIERYLKEKKAKKELLDEKGKLSKSKGRGRPKKENETKR